MIDIVTKDGSLVQPLVVNPQRLFPTLGRLTVMWNGPFRMMGGWDGSGWLWPFHFLIPLLFLAIIIATVVLAVRYVMGWAVNR